MPKLKQSWGSVLASSDTAADEAVLNNVHKKKNSKTNPSFLKLTTSWLVWPYGSFGLYSICIFLAWCFKNTNIYNDRLYIVHAMIYLCQIPLKLTLLSKNLAFDKLFSWSFFNRAALHHHVLANSERLTGKCWALVTGGIVNK